MQFRKDCIKSRRDKIGITRHIMMYQVIYILCSCSMKRVACTLYTCSTWCIMICLVIPILSLLVFIQSLYSLCKLHLLVELLLCISSKERVETVRKKSRPIIPRGQSLIFGRAGASPPSLTARARCLYVWTSDVRYVDQIPKCFYALLFHHHLSTFHGIHTSQDHLFLVA